MNGVLAIAKLEVLLRFRAGRWRWLLASWFAGLLLFSSLLSISISHSASLNGHLGDVLFGGLQLFMLLLALFIVPALTSQSVNGDRERGRLGVLQVTEVSSFDIIAGKLLAAWGTAAVFVAASTPITIWALVEGGISVVQVVVVTLVMLLLLGIICAIGLGLSALLARSTTSSVLTYVAVFVLALGTVILAGLVTAMESSSSPDQSRGQVWYLVAPNPFVILADAAPSAPVIHRCYSVNGIEQQKSSSQNYSSQGTSTFCQTSVQTGDVLGSIRMSVRSLESTNSLGDNYDQPSGGAIWPYGLAFDLLVAFVLLWTAVRSLATPKKRLPKGVRLA
jgi:ABC-type transport system involved in multi-copper enzyme maturation permease subunit